MRSLLDEAHKAALPTGEEEVWALNLDQIEPHSGKVLAKVMVNASEVGPSTYVFNKGTVLYCKLRPYLNKVVVADDDGVATTELVPLRCDESKVLPHYLAHFLRSATFLAFATNVVAGAKMPRMVMSEFWSYPVPLPPLEEQRRIAAILDQAETLRTQRRTALALLDSLTQSLFLDMFGDPVRGDGRYSVQAVETIASEERYSIVDGPFGSAIKQSDYLDTGIPVIRIGNLTKDGYYSSSNLLYIGRTLFESLKRSNVLPGDVLISRVGTLGNTCIYPPDAGEALLSTTGVCKIKVNPKVMLAEYLHAAIRCPSFQEQIQKSASTSVQKYFNLSSLKSWQIVVPPLPLQQTFATRIASIEALKATHRRALTALDALFASLQQRAFSGELTLAAPRAPAQSLEQLQQLEASIGLEALIFIAKRMPDGDLYNSLKAIYFADRHHLEHHGHQIYNETYCALPHGPVPQSAYDATRVLIGERMFSDFDDDAMRAALRRNDKKLTALRDADFSKLSRSVVESLEWAVRYCSDMKFGQTKTASHDSAYERTPKNEAIPLQYIIDTLPPEARQRHWNL